MRTRVEADTLQTKAENGVRGQEPNDDRPWMRVSKGKHSASANYEKPEHLDSLNREESNTD